MSDRSEVAQSDNSSEKLLVEELATEQDEALQDIEVLTPDAYEDADSVEADEERHQDGIVKGLKSLHCDSEEDLVHTNVRQHASQRNSSTFKRSHSQSIDGDMEGLPLDGHDLVSSTRRLRRRVRGPNSPFNFRAAATQDVDVDELETRLPFDVREFSNTEHSPEGQSSAEPTRDAMEVD